MSVYHTAGFTATWRYMAKIEESYIFKVPFFIRIAGYILGLLDPNSVKTIYYRTIMIDSMIKKLKPKYIAEIGAGFSSRPLRFENIKFYQLDLPYFVGKNPNIIPFEIGKDKLSINVKEALFIVEGVTMYLQKKEVISLLKQIKKYKGHLLIDFINKEYSTKNKTIREKIFKLIFKIITKRKHLFDYRIESIDDGISLLKNIGYKNVQYYNYKIPKSLDVLFYGEM